MVAPDALSLANRWQRGFPLAARPFARIALETGLDEPAVLENFRRLKREGVLDRIGPVFRPNAVGASSLAAMAVPAARLEEVARFVSQQPGVNHNYERSHAWNLWFVATGPDAAEVEAALSRIEQASGLAVLRLPLLEEYHIDLGFDLETRDAPRSPPGKRDFPRASVQERALVRETVGGLPLVPAPYAQIARSLGRDEPEVLGQLREMLADGRIRRIGAVIRHRRLGYEANAMVVWDVPEEQLGAVAPRLAGDAAVTLCYRRARVLPHWRYNLYCMVHGRARERVRAEVGRMAAAYGLARFPSALLFGERCFSQRAARYG
jgi:DNA-binding Lrp family transcriptional regulator